MLTLLQLYYINFVRKLKKKKIGYEALESVAPNENIVQDYLNMEMLNVF